MTPLPTAAPQFSFTINPTISIGDIISFLTFFGLIVGGIFALVRWFKDKAIKRSEYIIELTEKMRSDEAVVDAIDRIDHNHITFEEIKNSKETEKSVDKALSFLSYTCYLKKKRLISSHEFRFFEYSVIRALRNEEIVKYFVFLINFSATNGGPMSFYYLVDYGIRNRLLKKNEIPNLNVWKTKENKKLVEKLAE